VADPRAKHFQRLRRLRRSARRWSVAAGSLVATTAVLIPYHGLGLVDAVWAAAAGGTVALTWWRWSDARELAAQPAPEPLDPETRAAENQRRLESLVSRLPAGRAVVAELHRVQHLTKLRGSAVAQAGTRLDKAARSLSGLAGQVAPEVLAEGRAAEKALRDLAERAAGIERVLRLPPQAPGAHDMLSTAHAEMVEQFTAGVHVYEGYVAAAASVVAESGRMTGQAAAVDRLVEAGDRLRGIAEAMNEMTTPITTKLPGL
jgi:hypothetical protein